MMLFRIGILSPLRSLSPVNERISEYIERSVQKMNSEMARGGIDGVIATSDWLQVASSIRSNATVPRDFPCPLRAINTLSFGRIRAFEFFTAV